MIQESLPILLLPGDTFVNRAPDPVLQQVEHFDDATGTVNDAFRAVSRYFDRIVRPEQLIATLVRLPNLVQVLDRSADEVTVQLYGGLEVRLSIVPREAWGSALVWYTGSRKHVERLEALARARGWRLGPLGLEDDASGKLLEREREVGVYERLELPWIPPELREDEGEIEAAQAGTLPKLVAAGLLRCLETGPKKKYEHDYGYPQHEHLQCQLCGKMIEFQNPAIESVIRDVCRTHNFHMSGHTFVIRGICSECNRSRVTKRRLDLI